MNKQELKKIMEIAEDYDKCKGQDISLFEGCAYSNFKKVYCTKEQVASLFRYQALQFNGKWDMEALNECIEIARGKFTILN